MRQRIFELPESLVHCFLQYLIGPNHYFNGYSLMRVNKQAKSLLHKFIKQEIRHHNPHFFIDSIIDYDDHQYTLLLYDCIFSGNVYIIGGIPDTRKCDVFNTYTGKFKRICGVGNKRSEEFDAISYQGYLLVMSGIEEASMGSIEVYDLFTNTWLPFPSLPKKLVAPSSVVYQRRLYVTGGVERTSASRSNLIYELIHDQSMFKLGRKFDAYQQQQRSRSSSFSSSSAAASSPPILPPSSPQQQYHQRSQVFSKCQWEVSCLTLLIGRSHHSIVNYQNMLWIAGGITTGQWIATNTTEILNPLTGQSISGPSMLRNRLQPKLLVIDDCLYAVGGDMEGTVRSISSIERYEISKPGWMFVTFFHEPRRRSKCAITAYDHKIFVFGGSSDGGNTLNSWDYYNTRTKVWASQIKSYLQEGLIPSTPLSINGMSIPTEEVQYIATLDLNTIPVRPNGLKSALALPVTFD
eukprot:gene4324-4636_t